MDPLQIVLRFKSNRKSPITFVPGLLSHFGHYRLISVAKLNFLLHLHSSHKVKLITKLCSPEGLRGPSTINTSSSKSRPLMFSILQHQEGASFLQLKAIYPSLKTFSFDQCYLSDTFLLLQTDVIMILSTMFVSNLEI